MRIVRMLINRWGLLCFAAAAAVCFCGCGGAEEDDTLIVTEENDDTISYQYVTAVVDDVMLTQKIRCTYMQQNQQDVSFAITGRVVDKVYVEEGDMVKKGDLLAELTVGNLERQIEDLEYTVARNELLLEYAEANEALDISQAWVDRVYNWRFDDKGVKEYVDSIQQRYRYQKEDCSDSLELDRQKLAKLKQELRYCRVYAQMDGMVYKLEKDLEDSTSKEGKVIMSIVDKSHCLFEANAPEYADCFEDGQIVNMVINVGTAAGEYELLPLNMQEWGEIQQFSVLSGPMTSGIEVGTGGTIQFVMDSREGVVCLPKSLVYQADGKYYVYVAGEGDVREIRWVEIGLVGDDKVEITSGLTQGEKVIRR